MGAVIGIKLRRKGRQVPLGVRAVRNTVEIPAPTHTHTHPDHHRPKALGRE